MDERKQSNRLWLWLGAGVLLVIVFFVTRALTRERLSVRVTTVSRQQVVNQIPTNGRVEPMVNYEVHSPIASTVKAIFVQQGDQVAAGKVLLQLDDIQSRARLAAAESGVKSAQANLDAATHGGSSQERQGAAADVARATIDRDQAKRSLDALTKLKAEGAASASEVASAQERLDSAESSLHSSQESAHSRYGTADVARAQAGLHEAEAALAAARDTEAKTAPKAPFAGTVYSLNTGKSEFVEEGKTLLQLADLNHLHVVAYFDEPEIGRLVVGQSVKIAWSAKPDRSWTGHVSRVPSTVVTITGGTRTVGETIVDVDGGDGTLVPDTNVTVTVTTSSQQNAITIPRDALRVEGGKTYVYKVNGDSLVRTAVTVGTSNMVLTPILAGLQEGDVVATGTTNGLPLQENVPIKATK
jgi:HlyD family secretion protein